MPHFETAVRELSEYMRAAMMNRPRPVIRTGIGAPSRVEARHVEARAVVFDLGREAPGFELQRDLDVVL